MPYVIFAQELPRFENGILTIPVVSTDKNMAQYEFVQFKLARDGRWDLINFSESKQAPVESIDIKLLESFPVQAIANIQGFLPNGCYGLGNHYMTREGNQFSLVINMITLQTLSLVACTQAIVPFEITLPLDIYGLDAGQYQLIANGVKSSFELAVNNITGQE